MSLNMSPLTGPKSNQRGQLILITAIVIGFVLVGLVVVFNSGVVIERLESESAIRDMGEMQDAIDTVNRESARVILRTNNDEPGGNVGAIVRNDLNSMASILHTVQASTDGATIQLQGISVNEGYAVRQTTRTDFSSSNGESNWRVGRFSSVRRLQFNVDVSNLPNLGNGAGQSTFRDRAFHILFVGDSGTEFRVYFFRRGGDIGVATQTNNGPITQYTRNAGSRADIGVATGTINDVHYFEFNKTLTPPYNVYFRNGGGPTGIYTMTVDGNVDTSNVDAGSGTPYYTPAAYSAKFDMVYFNSEMQYSDSVTVAPCSIWDDQCYSGGDAGDV